MIRAWVKRVANKLSCENSTEQAITVQIPFLKKQVTPRGRVGIKVGGGEVALVYIDNGVIKHCFRQTTVDRTEQELAKDLDQLVSEYSLQDVPCTVVLHPACYQILLAEAPQVPEGEMDAALPWRIKDLLHHSLDELAIDHFAVPEDAYRSRQKMLYAVAMKKTTLTRWAGIIENSSLALDSIDIMELSLQKLLQQKASPGKNSALLYLDSDQGFMCVSQGGQIYLSRSIDMGVDKVVSTLPDDLDSFSGGQHLDNLLLEMQRSLDYYESQLGKGGVADLYVAPLGEHHERIAGFLDRNLAARAWSFDLSENFEAEILLDTDTQHGCFSAVSAAMCAEPLVEQNESSGKKEA